MKFTELELTYLRKLPLGLRAKLASLTQDTTIKSLVEDRRGKHWEEKRAAKEYFIHYPNGDRADKEATLEEAAQAIYWHVDDLARFFKKHYARELTHTVDGVEVSVVKRRKS